LVGASDLYSKRLANIHFWLALMGVLIYIVALWASGVAKIIDTTTNFIPGSLRNLSQAPLIVITAFNIVAQEGKIKIILIGALGWNAFVTFGTLYFLVPKLVGASDLYSKRLANIHFWLALMGVLIYIVALWAKFRYQGELLVFLLRQVNCVYCLHKFYTNYKTLVMYLIRTSDLPLSASSDKE
jgi:cbb3-type cytochrome oxidase subunit 1